MRTRSLRALTALAILGLLVVAARPAAAADKKKVVGGGSTFSQLLIDQWRADTRNKPYSLDFNYQGTGSSQGRLNFAQGTIDFAGSDIPYQPDDAARPPDGSYKYITAVAGALGFMYNLRDQAGNQITDLNLDQAQVCRLFTERQITKTDVFWDDDAIRAMNPGVALPHVPVKPVVRSDGSGTSFVLSEFCIATAKAQWDAFRGSVRGNSGLDSQALADGRPVSVWPPFEGTIAAAQSTGIANQVAAKDASANGRITYIESGYATITGLPLANVQNAHGDFVAPTPQGITVALSYASVRADGTFQLDFTTPDPAAYFPSTYSYLIVPAGTNLDPGKGRTLAEYVYYALTVGQDQAEPLDYARLSQNLIDAGMQTAASLNGATPLADWLAATGVAVTPVEGGAGASSGDGGGSSTGGGSTDGGSTGGGSTDGGSTGGGSTDGGSTGGGSTDGGSTGGGGTGGGSTGGSSNDNSGTGSNDSGDGSADTGTGSGGDAATGAAAGGATGGSTTTVKGGAAKGGPTTTVKGGAAKGSSSTGTKAGSTSKGGASLDGPVRAPGPSNADALWTMVQGATIVGAGMLLRRTLAGSSA